MNRFGPSLLILLAGLGFWVPGRLSLLRARHSLADAQAQLADLQDRIVADESRLASAREDRKRQNEARSQAVGELAGAQSELAKIDPEGQWANPPASLPDWHTDSPYSWRTKESLGELGLKVFAQDGGLDGEIASILAIDETTLRTLHEQLGRAVAEFLSGKRSTAQLSDDPVNAEKAYQDYKMRWSPEAMFRQMEARFRELSLKSSHDPRPAAPESDDPLARRKADGPLVAVVVPATTPEQTARLWDQIRQILEQNLGSQRAKLLMEMGGDRLDEACGQPVQSEISVIVMRHPDGKYMYDNSVGRFGEGVDASDVLRHMPPYLRSFFTDILNPSAAGNPVANPQAE